MLLQCLLIDEKEKELLKLLLDNPVIDFIPAGCECVAAPSPFFQFPPE